MANPPVTTRTLPVGIKLPEGFKTTIAFSLIPGVNLYEIDVPIPGAEATPIDTTTQLNTKWHTKWMSALVDSGTVSGTAGWDPSRYNDFIFLTGAQAGAFTIHFSTNATISCWGGLLSFVPQPHKFAQFPTVNFSVLNTNWDPVNNLEVGPYVVPSVGTP